ncbi:hypothetical protein ABIE86_005151 [Bradyrhizobium diazoefficiens]
MVFDVVLDIVHSRSNTERCARFNRKTSRRCEAWRDRGHPAGEWPYSTFAGWGWSADALAMRAAFAMPASAAAFFGSGAAPGCTTPADMIRRRGILGAHVDLDDLALGHVEEEARGRVRRARQEHRDVLLLPGQAARDLFIRRLRDQHDRPHARRRKLDQADFAEARALAREQRLEHLLQAAVDGAHRRDAAEEGLADIDQRPSDQVGREEADQRQREECDNQSPAGDDIRQIGFRTIGQRHERPHHAVDPGDEPPDQIESDRDRPRHHEAGQEVVADAAHQAGMRFRDGIKRRRRVVAGGHSGSRSVAAFKLGSSSRFWKSAA